MPITGFAEPVTQITAGKGHVLAVDNKCTVFSWGLNVYGQLGEDPKAALEVSRPRELKFFAGKNAVQIYAGDYTSCAVTKANIVYLWGLVWKGARYWE